MSDEEQRLLERFAEAHRRLDQGLIRPEQTAQTPERSLARWQARMAELRRFLAECGDPQRAFPAVHVTGTSGKGSVATKIARALHLAGYRVALHTSPYLQVPTEKNWIAGELMSAESFAELVDWVWPVALPRKRPETPASIHGMASVALSFEAIRRAEVDIAVIEAGCGGRFDLTNVLDSVATVVTSVGWDHALSLGPGLDDIAWHKAGILQPGVPAVTGATGSALEVIRDEARERGAELTEVPPLEGRPFWEVNAAIARAALAAIGDRFPVAGEPIDRAMTEGRLPARRELLPEGGRTVILDGAHNADKMAALVRTLDPGSVVVLGCLMAKDPSALVEAVRPAAAAVVATEPTVYAKPSTPAALVAEACRERGIEAYAEPDPMRAVDRALELAAPDQPVVITGSLYLAGEVRDRWYPRERVVLSRTSWPSPP